MLGEALRLIRVFHDMSQLEAAKALGVSNSYLSELEQGKKEPSLEVIRKYENVFHIPASSILFFSERMRRPGQSSEPESFVASKILRLLQFVEDKSGVKSGKEKRKR